MLATSSIKNFSFKNNWITILQIILILVLPLLITWIFAGEWNEGHNNWLVSGSYFSKLWAYGDKGWGFYFNQYEKAIVSWQPFIIVLGIWILNLIVHTILSWLKLVKVNGFNFINGIALMFLIIIVTGLWYPEKNNDGSKKLEGLIVSARIVIAIITFFVGFVISSLITNNILVHTKLGQEYGVELINEELEKQDYIKKNITPNKHKIQKMEKRQTIKKDNKKPKKKS